MEWGFITVTNNVARNGGSVVYADQQATTWQWLSQNCLFCGNSGNISFQFLSTTGYANWGYRDLFQVVDGIHPPFDSAAMTLYTLDCKIATLALNGGLVQTIALLPGSPAIDTGLLNNEQSPVDE